MRRNQFKPFDRDQPKQVFRPQAEQAQLAALQGNTGEKPQLNVRVATSEADQFHAFLTAAVIVLSVLVLVLFGIWLASFSTDQTAYDRTIPVTIESPDDSDSDRLTSLLDFDDPGLGELPEATQPQIMQTLLAVTDATSTVAASKVALLGTDHQEGKEGGTKGKELRVPGPQEDNTIPEWERWKIEFQPDNKTEYLEMLNSFEIYIGAVYPTANKICFVDGVTNEKPEMTVADRSAPEAQKLYFRNTTSKLKTWDRQVAVSAGVDEEDEFIVVQFYPDAVLKTLREAEAAVAANSGNKSIREIKKTTFRCRMKDDKYEFYVEDVIYRPDPG